MHTVFVYGILRSPDTVRRICTGWEGELIPAWLTDHITVRDMGNAYTFPKKGEIAEGYLLTGLTDEHLMALDRLEGVAHRHYDRVPVEVILTDTDEIVETEIYVGGPSVMRVWQARQNGIQPYQGTANFLPGRIGEAPSVERKFRRKHRATHQLFVYHPELFSIDRIEIITGHEWIGSRQNVTLRGVALTRTFPKILVVAEEDSMVSGYILTGLTDDDLDAIDAWMNIDQEYLKRARIQVNEKPYFAYVAGPKAQELIKQTEETSRRTAKARRKAERARIKAAKRDVVSIDLRDTPFAPKNSQLPLVSWQPSK